MVSRKILIRRYLARAFILAAIVLGYLLNVSFAFGIENVPGTEIALEPPPEFEPAQLFPGFEHVDTGSSIMVTELPFPFDLIREGMTSEGFASRGMELLASESVTYSGLPGLLISASQELGGANFRKWLAVFGYGETTAMIVASFPESLVAAMSDLMKEAVLSAELQIEAETDVFDGLTFRIDETPELMIADRIANMILLTKDGNMGAGPKDPLLLVGSAYNPYQIDDIETFSKRRILHTAYVENIRDIEGKATAIDGVQGYEITAAADDTETGIPMVIFQVIVAKQGTYYIVQGLVGEPAAAKYVPEFKKVAGQMTFTE